MTDVEIAAALVWARDLEGASRECWSQAGEDLAEKDAALVVYRQAVAVRRHLEAWVSTRAIRATRIAS